MPQDPSTHTLPLYPDPGDDRFQVQLAPDDRSIEVFDALGRCARRERIDSQQMTIETGDLMSGAYFVGVRNDRGGMRVQRWVKE